MQRQSGLNLDEFFAPYKYAMYAACRNKQLGPDAALAAYLADPTGRFNVDAHWAIAGLCPEALQAALQAQRAKPIPLQLVNMRRRRMIDSGQYISGMRELGYLDPTVSEQLFRITEQVPSLTDLMRLMIRDTDDDTIEFWPESDRLFQQKYKQTLREWAEFQGVPEKVALYTWRAHWIIPPPTALFEFWHRLRKNKDFGGEEKLLAQIKSALIQQDILPYWHKHYLAISFRPMGRVDIRRSYNIGTLTDDQVKDAYTQLGYSDDTVDLLFKFSKRLRAQSLLTHRAVKLWIAGQITREDAEQRLKSEGFDDDTIGRVFSDSEASFASSELSKAYVRGDLSRRTYTQRLVQAGVSNDGATKLADRLSLRIRRHPAIADYAVGLLNDTQAKSQMTSYGIDTDIADMLLEETERSVKQALLAQCQRGIKRKYLLGEITKGQAHAELVNRGTVESRAAQLTNWWDCERSSVGKSVPAAKLCDWLARGAITTDDLRNRLERIGYRPESAALMVEDCLISVNARRLADAKRQAKEQAQESLRAARILQRQVAQENRVAAQLQRQAKQAQQTRQRRERQALTAAQKIAAKGGVDLFDALAFVNVQRNRVKTDYGLSTDESLIVITKSVDYCPTCDLATLTDVISQMAESAAVEAGETDAELAGISVSSNGHTQPSG
jgi:hypothetical protein